MGGCTATATDLPATYNGLPSGQDGNRCGRGRAGDPPPARPRDLPWRGQIRKAYREGQEGQLAALGLVLNAVVLWNTRYLDAAVAQLRAEGHDIKGEDVARISPFKDRHMNFLGRYLFNIAASGPRPGAAPPA